ncbi:MAG: endonuclease domain-containing protein [Bacteroidaceae bacterium]|nr:endonuclease domain-containing protein [Bacteroidaceae bacterium]
MKPTYPVVLYPTSQVAIKPEIRFGTKFKMKGHSELVAYAKIDRLVLDDIQADLAVRIDRHWYEPDFAYSNSEKGIYIDIEVDEPYAANGKPTHYMVDERKSADCLRDNRFQKAGWYVVRFSEEQIFRQTRQCLLVIYELLVQIGCLDRIPEVLSKTDRITPSYRWSMPEAMQLKAMNYREHYLGYNPMDMGARGYLACTALIMPIMFRSIWRKKLRKEMLAQLYDYFIK